MLSLFHDMRSFCQAWTTNSTPSRHMSRDRSSAGTWNASCSLGVDRPVPHSTRPRLKTSTVATFSATRIGCWNPGGMNTTPKPSRMFLVAWDSAPRMTSFDGDAERISRKWCSTTQTVWKPSRSASLISSKAS